ncbi:uncharacterized protein LOC107042297 [Diachasma alloeum]|uniref:uncharacterized protein LOC107042297 n=1 Tax=Diachasma alloeum TaxID=454923 RepID=UPI000738408A|nr:uncharacterized protein LOC107042297 [Diachasma alloeum]
MPSSKIKYSSTKAIDNFSPRASLMKIIGYVDCIEGLKELPKSASKWIHKCILNNNDGRRVRIIFWGDDALKYNDELKMYQILKITGSTIKEANAMYRRSGDTVGNKEFQFGRGSTIETLGGFKIANGAGGGTKAITYTPIKMAEVCEARHPVMVTGWLKEHFRSITTSNGTSYGCGLICTEVHQMTVHIATFVPREDLIAGMKIAVKGTIDRRFDAFVLHTSSMDGITIVPGAEVMSEDEMDEAVESPPLVLKREVDVSSQPTDEKSDNGRIASAARATKKRNIEVSIS